MRPPVKCSIFKGGPLSGPSGGPSATLFHEMLAKGGGALAKGLNMVRTFQFLTAVWFCPAAVLSNTGVFRCGESSHNCKRLCIFCVHVFYRCYCVRRLFPPSLWKEIFYAKRCEYLSAFDNIWLFPPLPKVFYAIAL
jgi:hypothetical protein